MIRNGDWIDDKIKSWVSNNDSIDYKEREFLVEIDDKEREFLVQFSTEREFLVQFRILGSILHRKRILGSVLHLNDRKKD